MIDVNDILKNETIQGLLKKAGVSDEQAKSVADQAVNTIKSKFSKDPKKVSSLLSENPNSDDDNVMAAEIENDFLDGLIKKVGLPESIASQVKGAMPGILSQVTSKLSADGKNDEGGIAGLLGNITDMFDGDNSGNKKGGGKSASSGISGLFKKFFGK
jgi:hypothetical protein